MKNLWMRLMSRLFPIAPFVLDVCDKLTLDPLAFVALTTRTDMLLAIRAVGGEMGRNGIVVGYDNNSKPVYRSWMFPDDGVPLNWREREALSEAINLWVDTVYGENGLMNRGLA